MPTRTGFDGRKPLVIINGNPTSSSGSAGVQQCIHSACRACLLREREHPWSVIIEHGLSGWYVQQQHTNPGDGEPMVRLWEDPHPLDITPMVITPMGLSQQDAHSLFRPLAARKSFLPPSPSPRSTPAPSRTPSPSLMRTCPSRLHPLHPAQQMHCHKLQVLPPTPTPRRHCTPSASGRPSPKPHAYLSQQNAINSVQHSVGNVCCLSACRAW
jgi:hypothetical protein